MAVDLSCAFAAGCSETITKNTFCSGFFEFSGYDSLVVKDFLDFYPNTAMGNTKWSMCFTQTTETPTQCNA